MRTHRPRRRLLRQAQALSQRGLLYRAHLPVHGLSPDDVPGALRHSAHVRVARAVGRDAAGPRTEDRAAPADLSWPRYASIRAHRSTLLKRRANINQDTFLAQPASVAGNYGPPLGARSA